MKRQPNRILVVVLGLALVACTEGCIALTSNLIHAIRGGPKVPAAFAELKGKQVAVICISQSDLYGTGGASRLIARSVEKILQKEVKEIKLVGQDPIEDWLDHNDWNQINFAQIGRGVKANYVVAIELNQPISLKEGPTLFKGRADFTVSVYDVAKNGQVAMRKHTPEFAWPTHGRYGVSEAAFERMFLEKISVHVARYFHEYETDADLASEFESFQ